MAVVPAHILAAWSLGIATVQAQGHAIPSRAEGVISGQVVDQQTRAPIGGAVVNLVGMHLHTRTDSGGRFNNPGLVAGTYIVEVRAVGYGVTSWVIRLSEGEAIDYVFEVVPLGVDLSPVVVEGQPGYFQRRMQEFEERRRAGRGIFITEDQIVASHANTVGDLLRGVPGLRLSCRSGNCTAQMTRTARGVCTADWVIDGMPANMSGTPRLPALGIVAIEIYRNPSEAPAEFLRADSDCGVIAIWTKSGP
jgi:Carboxypeptidase regulatory-like domain/TonB-dependent Receptor Plug Domain